MNKNTIKNDIRDAAASVKQPDVESVCVRGDFVWCESSGDFNLPDYMPKIGKMLTCTPRLVPTGRYIGSDRAEFSGSIVYSVLYTGEDGAPYRTTLSGDYEYTVPLGEAAESVRVEVYDEPIVESVSMRAGGPRKMSVRTRIRSTPCITYDKEKKTALSDAEGKRYEKLTEVVPVTYYRHFESGEFDLCENFRLDASPEAEAVGCDGAVCVTEAAFSAGNIICRGEAEFRILYFDIAEGRRKLLSSQKKIRFERRVAVPLLAEPSGMRVYGRLISADLAASEDTSEISVSAVLALYGEYTGSEERPFLLDVYSCEHPCGVEREEVEYRRAVLCKNANYSYHSQQKLPEPFSSGADVCTSVASARIDEVSVGDGVVEMSGEITVECVLCRDGEGGVEYSLVELPIPVRCELPAERTAQKYETSVICEVGGVRTRIDGDNLCADAELYLAAIVNGVESVKTVRGTYPVDEAPERCGGLTVYYPDSDETLWSVAKKFAVPVSAVAAKNGLGCTSPDSADSLDGADSLLIS